MSRTVAAVLSDRPAEGWHDRQHPPPALIPQASLGGASHVAEWAW